MSSFGPASYLKPAVNRQPLFPRGGLEELVKSIDNIIKSKGVKQAQYLMKYVQVLNKHTKHGVDQRNLPRNTEIINDASEPTKPPRQQKKTN